MGVPVLIYGKSGSGKSRSLKYFGNEILLLNVESKPLPFRSNIGHVVNTSDVERMKSEMYQAALAGCRTAVIDDAGYIMTDIFMSQHRSKKGDKSFEMYNDIADVMYSLIRFIKDSLPPDMLVYILLHEDTNDYGDTKLRTIGKLLDSKVCLEGMVTICIRCMSKAGKHFFRVSTDGNDISKAPEDMFPQDEFENNLKYVNDAIRQFYGWGPQGQGNGTSAVA